ncbi:MAG TPA: NAD(P)H-dependent oxidoreductase subunit E [Phycisphaerae bacterium]|nr:NAD(P)H-dependent oxidoreductase subunit E [Phycisphaerae bacterium]HRY70538.1 NAD(P)H-dependent oxidoreductase subunit E [Phycisphaerae bacterium]HSA27986.1 NAD(P)H-dependent oxidoreductase subunit E [Phycisphaerae bacterium]
MSQVQAAIREVCQKYGNDRTRMMDIVRAAHAKLGCVCGDAMDTIAAAVSAPRVEVESVVTFYAFFSRKARGQVIIRLCNDIIDQMAGSDRVAQAFRESLGIDFGETTPDGKITLEWTPCIGMCDQAPAALVNDVVVTHLSSDKVDSIVRSLKAHLDPKKLVQKLGDGNNANDLVRSMVENNIRKSGPVVLADLAPGDALRKALAMSPQEVIRDIKTSRLRGRGGAGFPTGIKWDYTRSAEGGRRYVVCNGDEGEPGTFKDRVILTEKADLLFEGMTIAGYAIGSDTGILYLRGEYAYLQAYLEHVLNRRRHDGLLGKNICGKMGFDFAIRIQMGAGAYVCGEETALLSSCEGRRGDPKNRPPFPAQKGYLGCPTTVNNVETFCCVARILDKGPGWFAQLGSTGSSGTKLLSVSGDCMSPGVYEVPFGIKLRDVLKLCGAEGAIAVQVGGPSGQMVGPKDYDRTICYDDLATGGSIMVFGPERSVLEVAGKFMEFFVEESCGYCTPCRVGNVLLKERIDRILAGLGEMSDLEYLENLGQSVKSASRCGLGQTSANPILTTLKNFRSAYEAILRKDTNGTQPTFDIHAALSDAQEITGRESVHF